MSGFTDRIGQSDGVTLALNCGLCGQPAGVGHNCTKRYLRSSRVVLARCMADPSSTDPDDLFLIRLEKGGEEYTTTRATLERDYEEI